MEQISFLDHSYPPQVKKDISGTFTHNMKQPIHRWFRYSAGFSAEWVKKEIEHYKVRFGSCPNILDPFAGSGTVLLEADMAQCPSIGVEAHPFVSRVAKSKLLWNSPVGHFTDFAMAVLNKAKNIKADIKPYPDLIKQCFSIESLVKLDQLKRSFLALADNSSSSTLNWLILTTILRECSFVGTAQCQYILPKKRKIKFMDPYNAFLKKMSDFRKDMFYIQSLKVKRQAQLIADDIRKNIGLPKCWGDLLITSPPYVNNYDYADAVRLELSFWEEVRAWKDLQTVIRPYLVRSCTQHIATCKSNTYKWLDHQLLMPIKTEIFNICQELEKISKEKKGKKPYHTMISAYFLDMAKIWRHLRVAMRPHSTVCFVVGDSAPYGIYVPVDKWLGELAISAGFKSYRFEKIRDRNIKWKNRKHKVPLKEGYLWIRG